MLLLILSLFSTFAFAQAPAQYACGMATGFEPYQYVDSDKPQGLDVELFRAINGNSTKVELKPMAWRDALSQLEFGLLDCVLGMEITEARSKLFFFGSKLYDRQIRIFVPHNSKIISLAQLKGKIVANDRGSQLFHKLRDEGIAKNLRLLDVATKAESFELLRTGKVVAMIGPKRVVHELSRKSAFKVRALEDVFVDVPVAIAFKKTDHPLRLLLKSNMLSDKTIKKIRDLVNRP